MRWPAGVRKLKFKSKAPERTQDVTTFTQAAAIEAETDEQLEEKLCEYDKKARSIGGRDTHMAMAFNLKQAIQRELWKRKDTATTSCV